MIKIYDLRDDTRTVKLIQHATLHTDHAGLRPDHGLLGSKEWWQAVDQGLIPQQTVEGIISRVYMSGHGDFPEFELHSEDIGKTNWERRGEEKYYVIGRGGRIVYVLQEFKQPFEIQKRHSRNEQITHSKVVLEIWVENSESGDTLR